LQGEIVLSNKAGDEFFGPIPVNPDEKVSALDCFVKDDIPRIVDNFKKSAQGINTEPGEFTAIKKDGSLCPVMVFGTPIIRNGKIVGRRGIIIDISERKKQEMGLLKAKEELERINNTLEQHVAERTKQLTEANTQLLKVQKENLQSQFEVLKQQVNPHFLFNSLNVLTSLIKIDPDLAESFTERLSKVYRYVLENKEKDVVSLSTELEFLNAYLFLLEIRFMNKIVIEINIDKSYYDFQILPIAIQLLIENAVKHNTFSKVKPLKIEIFVDRQQKLNIVNNLNLRETKFASTGVGLENISRRYALVSDQKPEFNKTGNQFIAKLPLLKSEKIETE
jgi:PAS domain S-box-containing protein